MSTGRTSHLRKWILILHNNLVKQSIINTHSHGAIFLPLHKRTRAPHGDTLGPDQVKSASALSTLMVSFYKVFLILASYRAVVLGQPVTSLGNTSSNF